MTPVTPRTFQIPPVDYRPWTRWWWPGGDVELDELRRELRLFAEHHFGGAEIQPFTAGMNPKTREDRTAKIYDYGSAAYYKKVVAVLEEARALGLQIDLTMGSSWPPGDEFVPLEDNPDTLLYGEMTITRAVDMPVPTPIMPFAYAIYSPKSVLPLLVNREWTRTISYHPEAARLVAVVAAQIVEDGRSPDPSVLTDTLVLNPATAQDISRFVQDGHLRWQPPAPGAWQIIALYTMPSGSRPLNSAYRSEAYVVDPFDSDAITRYYENWIGQHPELLAHAGTTLRALFSDSYEYFAQRHFADDLIETFRANRSYDITPLLPAVFQPGRDQHFFFFSGLRTAPDFSFGDISKRLIHDYDLTVSDLFFKHWYPASRTWIEARGLQFRQQGYNPPLDVIKAAGAASIPETEGGNELMLKRVASGGHLYGRPLITAEAFVFFPQGGFALTPQDYRQGIDVLMTAGVNQIIYHGTPYRWPEPGYGEIGWSPFISPYGAINISTNISEADPFWKYQREINLYAARLQLLLRQGAPDADVLVYLPVFDNPADARFTPVIQTLDTSGRTWEWVNDDRLASAVWTPAGLQIGGMTFRAVVLPNVPALPLETAEKLLSLAEAGAPVIVYGQKPAQQPGYYDYQARDRQVAAHLESLIGQPQSTLVTEPEALAERIGALPAGPIRCQPNGALRSIRRRLDDGSYLVFIRSTSDQPTTFTLNVDSALRHAYWLEAVSGHIYPADSQGGWLPGFGSIALLASPVAYFSDAELTPGSPVAAPDVIEQLPLTAWTLEITGEDGQVMTVTPALGDWAAREDLQVVSSVGRYTTTFTLNTARPDQRYALDLGAVFAAADVSVNDQPAGHAIFAPYQVDLSGCLKAGENILTVAVTPALRNRLLGKARSGSPEYAQFLGSMFGPARPVPSGLVGPVTLNIVRK